MTTGARVSRRQTIVLFRTVSINDVNGQPIETHEKQALGVHKRPALLLYSLPQTFYPHIALWGCLRPVNAQWTYSLHDVD
jgi:hypothetical protein